MNYEVLKKRIQIEANKQFRTRVIISQVKIYFKINNVILTKGMAKETVVIRYIIFYICCTIYGIQSSMVANNMKMSNAIVHKGNNIIKGKIHQNASLHFHIEAIRARLTKILNG